MRNSKRKSHYIECNCTSAEHIVRITVDRHEDFPAMYVDIQLNRYHNVFGRLWRALLYVFGYQCRYGHWDEMALMGEDVKRLRDLCGQHLVQWEAKYGSLD